MVNNVVKYVEKRCKTAYSTVFLPYFHRIFWRPNICANLDYYTLVYSRSEDDVEERQALFATCDWFPLRVYSPSPHTIGSPGRKELIIKDTHHYNGGGLPIPRAAHTAPNSLWTEFPQLVVNSPTGLSIPLYGLCISLS